MNIVICTLFEGDYHIGAAALINSLRAAGFCGTVFAGHRGPPPPWAASVDGVVFVSLETTEHLTNHKPAFLRRVFTQLAPDADAVAYFDPDIVVKCRWDSVFPHWLDGGLALVEDVNAAMPARHPQRLAWTRWLAAQSLEPTRAPERYYNAGFVGVPRAHMAFLDTWQNVLALAHKTTVADPACLKSGDATSLFHTPDQDALNIALMLDASVPLNTAGPDAMDFAPGGHYLSHATGTPKPWQRGHLRRAFRGYPPSQAVKNFYQHTERPVALFTAAQRRRRRAALALAAFIGRFYRRA